MKGAREYVEFFKQAGEQIGRLWIASGSHARGRTLHIYVTPKDFKVTSFHPDNGFPYKNDNKDLVEVFGVTRGNPGWTEEYGWLADGDWQEDFAKIVNQRRETLLRQAERDQISEYERKKRERQDKEALLRDY